MLIVKLLSPKLRDQKLKIPCLGYKKLLERLNFFFICKNVNSYIQCIVTDFIINSCRGSILQHNNHFITTKRDNS